MELESEAILLKLKGAREMPDQGHEAPFHGPIYKFIVGVLIKRLRNGKINNKYKLLVKNQVRDGKALECVANCGSPIRTQLLEMVDLSFTVASLGTVCASLLVVLFRDYRTVVESSTVKALVSLMMWTPLCWVSVSRVWKMITHNGSDLVMMTHIHKSNRPVIPSRMLIVRDPDFLTEESLALAPYKFFAPIRNITTAAAYNRSVIMDFLYE